MFKFLSGKRTFICAFIIGAVTVAHYFGYFDVATYNGIIGLFSAGGLAALRAALHPTPLEITGTPIAFDATDV